MLAHAAGSLSEHARTSRNERSRANAQRRRERGRVFERFTRLDWSRSRASGGAGLGLALARGLVREHGGDVWIEDGRGRGACFVVVLPVDRERTTDVDAS